MTDPFPITVFHNPNRDASRNALGIVEAAGYVPFVEYLRAG